MLTKRRYKKKRQYRKVTFKLTARQKRSLDNYCAARKTTPTKLIKKSIRYYIENFAKDVPDEYYVTERQLDIFDALDEED